MNWVQLFSSLINLFKTYIATSGKYCQVQLSLSYLKIMTKLMHIISKRFQILQKLTLNLFVIKESAFFVIYLARNK